MYSCKLSSSTQEGKLPDSPLYDKSLQAIHNGNVKYIVHQLIAKILS